jgi:hypothetical protein
MSLDPQWLLRAKDRRVCDAAVDWIGITRSARVARWTSLFGVPAELEKSKKPVPSLLQAALPVKRLWDARPQARAKLGKSASRTSRCNNQEFSRPHRQAEEQLFSRL